MTLRPYTGIAARQIVFLHLRSIAFVMFVLLIVAIAIDLTKHLDAVRLRATETGTPFAPLLAKYLGYRAVDIITRLLPMASLIGALITELLRHQRMENVIFAAAGASPGLLYSALFIVGLTVGAIQTGLEGWLRPAAVWAQVDLGLGSYAERFRRGPIGPEWFTDPTRAMRATVMRSDTPDLRNVTLFEGIENEALTSVTQAARAIPGTKPESWTLIDVTRWHGPPGAAMQPEHLPRLMISFPLLPAHLEYYEVLGLNLPNAPLHEIAAFPQQPQWADAETAIARRYLAILLPGVFAFLGASLSQAGQSGRLMAWWRLLPLGGTGYITLVSVKSFWALGEVGILRPWIAASAPLAFAFALACVIQLILNGRLRLPRRGPTS